MLPVCANMTLWNWSMNEGSFTVTINYSDQSASVFNRSNV